MTDTVTVVALGGVTTPVPVEQWFGEHLAFHAMPPEDGDKPRRAWTLTHAPTGRWLATGVRRKTDLKRLAQEAVDRATELGVDLGFCTERELGEQPGGYEWAAWLMKARRDLPVLKACQLP